MKKDNIDNSNKEVNKTNLEQEDKEQNKLFWLVTFFAILLISAGTFAYISSKKYHADRYDTVLGMNSDLAEGLAYRDSLINEWMETFNEIEKDLLTMQDKENLLKINSSDSELKQDIRERIKIEIRHLNSLLKENKEKIAGLNRKLEKSGVQIAALNNKIIQLGDAIDQRDRTLADLKFQLIENDFKLADLNMLIDSLDYEILQKKEEISTKNKEILKNKAQLNRAYIASGTTRELRDRGLLQKEGGFLGLFGKSKNVSTKLSDKEFQEIDIMQTDRITINAKKVEFISDHPLDSYEIIKNDSLIAYVQIEDPNTFWKLTRYAVIETK
ncbi:MAG TPA: hypothetical protein DCG75_18465 [Bacteroidales bacterium]|jgi:hypothetical protein|nr:hypothetical protein [Bacteroidales bacterium]